MIPRHYFIILSAAICIESRINLKICHCIIPSLWIKVLIPAIQTASFFPDSFNHIAQTAVTFCQHRFDKADICIMIADTNLFGFYACKQVFLFFSQQLHAVLCLKLEWSERLWNKACTGNGNAYCPALWTGRQAVIQIHYFLCKVCNSFDIFHGFGRQTHHEIQFYRGIAALKCGTAGIHQFFFGYIFIDNIAQALGSSFRRKGKAALFQSGYFLHQLFGEVVHTQARQRKADLFIGCPVEQIIQKWFDLLIVTGGKGGQRQLLITAGVAQTVCILVEGVIVLIAQRAIDKSCLAETASTQTSALYFQHCAVMDNINKWNDKFIWIEHLVQICNNALFHLCRCSFTIWGNCFDGVVLIVGNIIQTWNINAADLCSFL